MFFSPQQCYTLSSQKKTKEIFCLAWFLMQQVIEQCNFFPKEAVVARWVIQGFKERVDKYKLEKPIEGH